MTRKRKIEESIKKTMTRRIIWRTLLETFVLMLILVFLYIFGKFVCSFQIWHEYEITYRILKLIDNNILFFIVLICGFGMAVILLRTCRKTFGYLVQMLRATEAIYSGEKHRIELPEQLKEVENQLNSIQLNVRENERAAKEAEQRKNDLIVYLAHDLKTPLTSVIGYLSLLSEEKEISPELRQKYLSISLDKAERLEELINEFFEITRFNLTTLTLELSTINLTRMLEQIAYEFKPMLLEKNLGLKVSVERDFMLTCDADKMQRVFDNLLKNAVNYCFEDSTIEITAEKKDTGVSIRIMNSGNTIPKEKLNRIFEQFYRLDSSRSTKAGAGLGLAIAKEIVELHRGNITATSENNQIIFDIELSFL